MHKATIGYCYKCGAHLYTLTNGGDYESEKAVWEYVEWDCEHAIEGCEFEDPVKLAPQIQDVIDNFKEVVWHPLRSHKPSAPKFKRGIV